MVLLNLNLFKVSVGSFVIGILSAGNSVTGILSVWEIVRIGISVKKRATEVIKQNQ